MRKYNSGNFISKEYLDSLKPAYKKGGWPVPKWIVFCEKMIDAGWKVSLYRAKTTVSKYIYIHKEKNVLKIRFSNHRANVFKELNGDCDFYVGIGNNGVITTEQLIDLLNKKYDKKPCK